MEKIIKKSVRVKFEDGHSYVYNTFIPVSIGSKVLVSGKLSSKYGYVEKVEGPLMDVSYDDEDEE